MSHAKNKIEWCLRKAENELSEGKKHRGLLHVTPNIARARLHVLKAEHNLKAMLYLKKGGFSDWCTSTAFYSVYHCMLAILAKLGYESRNQECTFAFIQNLVDEKKIAFSKEDIEKLSLLNSGEHQETPTLVSIREEFQYTAKLTLKDDVFDDLLDFTKRMLDTRRTNLYIQIEVTSVCSSVYMLQETTDFNRWFIPKACHKTKVILEETK